MTADRAITSLELVPMHRDQKGWGEPTGWVQVTWKRKDGSGGEVFAYLRQQAAERCAIYSIEVPIPTTALLRDIPLARIEAAANADPSIRQWVLGAMPEGTEEAAKSQAARRVKLRAPKKRLLDDRHYRLVADAYRGAVANGLSPAKTLADESGVPQGTVNRWIAEARRRGYLPPGEPGRVIA